MNTENTINIIISGIGGQGVFSLTKVIWNLCAKYDFKCQGSTFKGGAQKAGSIHSEMRIFFNKNQACQNYSNQIRKGTLDLIIGLEPWETLRYADYFNKNTKVLVNSVEEPLYVERFLKEKSDNPILELKKILTKIIEFDFSKEAIKEYDDIRMVNYLMLMKAIQVGYLPFKEEDATEEFLSLISPIKQT